MNSHTHCNKSSGNYPATQQSRSARFNVQVEHPSRWRLVLERLLASQMRIHRYRTLSVRMFEDTMDSIDRGSCK
jgi:hypothetical protein